MAVVTSHLEVSGSVVARHCTRVLISLALNEPLVSVNRLVIGDTGVETSRFVVERVRRSACQYIVRLPLGRVVEVPYEIGTVSVRLHRFTNGVEDEFVRLDVRTGRSNRSCQRSGVLRTRNKTCN